MMMSMTRKPSRSQRQWHPGRRREQGHDDAVAEARLRKAPKIPDHPLITKDDPQLVTTDDALTELIEHLRNVGQFGYDTEFIGEMNYFSRICVIQVATHQRVALIDPLEKIDLNPIWELIADPDVGKIVHAGDQDLEPVVRNIDKPPANIFDTQIACGFIGRSYPAALAKLVSDLLEVELGKGLTYTSWDRRPMSAVHQHYAADDVRYLPAIKEAIDRELAARGHTQWAAVETASLCDKARYLPDPQAGFYRIKGATSLAYRKQQILRALLVLRDQIARDSDVPPRSIISDPVLLLLARQPIKSADQLDQVSSLARAVREKHGQAIVDATAQAESQPAEQVSRPARHEDTVSQRFAIDALWSMAAGCCHGCGIDPGLVTNRQEVADWYRTRIHGHSPSNGRLSSGWRAKLLHEPLTAFLDGNTQLRFTWNDDTLNTAVDDASP
jgi:ribonuclease D